MKNYKGLSDNEVQEKLNKYGSNKLSEVKKESFLKKYIGCFEDPIIRLLGILLIVCSVFACFGKMDWIEILGIFIAVMLATMVSTVAEMSNENAFQKLQEEANDTDVMIYRNGKLIKISINDVVHGDYIYIKSGEKVPADGFIIEGEIKVNQSALNGEPEEVSKVPAKTKSFEKYTNIKDFSDKSKVFRGSVITQGHAVMIVTNVGDQSIFGALAKELQEDNEIDTPLQVKLNKLADQISKLGTWAGIAIAIAFMGRQILTTGVSTYFTQGWFIPVQDLINSIIYAFIVIIVAIPEGLPLSIAIVSSSNSKKMLKDNVLVRKINSVETAGSLNVLCTDKTGTLTTGNMVVDKMFHFVEADRLTKLELINMKYNNDVVYDETGNIVSGNSTNKSIIEYLKKNHLELFESSDYKVNKEIEFTSSRKYSAVEVTTDTHTAIYVKGAAEKVLAGCSKYINEGNKIAKLTKEKEKEIQDALSGMTTKSMRVLCLAIIPDTSMTEDEIDFDKKNLVFCGLIGIRDTIRKDVPQAVADVQDAGVQVIMVTGDNIETAISIGREVGIIKSENDIVMTSDKFNSLPDEVIKATFDNIRIIARALPSDKTRIVRIAQEMNKVVGMTGDGINDAPALKRADIGFGMGDGTDVAKEASEMVILNNSFSSIRTAILYGRTIFKNLSMFIKFQLTINIAFLLISFIAPLLGFEQPISVIQALFVNLLIDTFAGLQFAGISANPEYMKEKPKKRDEEILKLPSKIQIGTIAMFILFASLVLMFDNLQGLVFPMVVVVALFMSLSLRVEGFNIFKGLLKEKSFITMFFVIIGLLLVLIYPLGNFIGATKLGIAEWIFVIVIGIIGLFMHLFLKTKIKENV